MQAMTINCMRHAFVEIMQPPVRQAVQPSHAHRLAEAHLVGQDAVDAVLVQRDEPLDALDLVVAQVSLEQRQPQALHAHRGLPV